MDIKHDWLAATEQPVENSKTYHSFTCSEPILVIILQKLIKEIYGLKWRGKGLVEKPGTGYC